jgi:hypothetical protein
MSKREQIDKWVKEFEEKAIFYEGFDEAIIGLTQKFNYYSVLYDYDMCINILRRDMTYEEAEEYMSYNVIGMGVGNNTPSFLIPTEVYVDA